MSLRFGTDGIRGVALEQLTVELSFALGRAAASVFGADTYAIGRDTRESGPVIQQALADGLGGSGATVLDLGVLPTPGIAYASATLGIPAAVVSASHNPFHDNGIKFFAPGGRKLSAAQEQAIEAALSEVVDRRPVKVTNASEFGQRYMEHLKSAAARDGLDAMELVVDCAHGSASAFAADLYEFFGCNVHVINAQPDGRNINDNCGSTHLQPLEAEVRARKPHAGIAFDGDADRVLMVDENGQVVDGDAMMGILAIAGKKEGWLTDDTLVLTVMSNLGLRLSMQAYGVNVYETPVGDKYVLEALAENGWSLGGEQSGHIILAEHASTGDGMLTALNILDVMNRRQEPLSVLAAEAMTRLPQVLRNVRVQRLADLAQNTEIHDAVRDVSARLGETGRVLLRPSGTEPLVRVMAEAPTQELASEVVDELIAVVTHALGKA